MIHAVSCTPKTCSQLGLSCGSISSSENCGTALSCGSCASGQTCDDGACVTTPPTSSYAKSWWTGTLQNGGLCAGVPGSDQLAPGAVIKMETCTHDGSGLDQNWQMTKNRQLKNYRSGKCLEPESVSSGSLTRQRECDGSDENRIWRFRGMEIVNGQTGYCADVPADLLRGPARDSVAVPWRGQSAVRVHAADIRDKGESICLDAGTGANGAPVTLQQCDGTSSQQWNDGHGGFVSALATANPRCLALQGGATAGANASLIVSNCSDTVDQMWGLRGQIEHFDDEYCLKNADTTAHELKLKACSETVAGQKFTYWMNF